MITQTVFWVARCDCSACIQSKEPLTATVHGKDVSECHDELERIGWFMAQRSIIAPQHINHERIRDKR